MSKKQSSTATAAEWLAVHDEIEAVRTVFIDELREAQKVVDAVTCPPVPDRPWRAVQGPSEAQRAALEELGVGVPTNLLSPHPDSIQYTCPEGATHQRGGLFGSPAIANDCSDACQNARMVVQGMIDGWRGVTGVRAKLEAWARGELDAPGWDDAIFCASDDEQAEREVEEAEDLWTACSEAWEARTAGASDAAKAEIIVDAFRVGMQAIMAQGVYQPDEGAFSAMTDALNDCSDVAVRAITEHLRKT